MKVKDVEVLPGDPPANVLVWDDGSMSIECGTPGVAVTLTAEQAKGLGEIIRDNQEDK